MSHVADAVQLGLLPLRHHAKDFDPSVRVVMYACRVGGPDETGGASWGGEGIDQFGAPKPETVVGGGTADTVGDVLGAGLWLRQTGSANDRFCSGWNWAWPSVTTGATFGSVPSLPMPTPTTVSPGVGT